MQDPGDRMPHGVGMDHSDGGGLVLGQPGDHAGVAGGAHLREDPRDLVGGLTLAVDDLGHARPNGAMEVEGRVAEATRRPALELPECVGYGFAAGRDALEERLETFWIHGGPALGGASHLVASSGHGMLGFYLVGAALATERPAGALLTERALELVNDHYLHPESFSTTDAFAGAAEALERVIPWLIVEERGRDVVLSHGARGALATLRVDGSHVLDLVPALARLESAVAGAGEPLPPGIDLEVEMLKGVTTALDPHSTILTDERLERFDERISGKLTGIGGTLGKDPGGELVIRDVYPDGPAARALLQPGDRIVRIDGTSTTGMTVAQATERIRGPIDTAVTLTVRDALANAETMKDVALVRAEVVVPNVTWRKLASGAGLVRIDHFSEQTVALVRDAIAALQSARATGVVIDLRGNAGGSMLQSAECADLFLEAGTLLRTVGRSGRKVANLQSYMEAQPQGIEPDLPVVALLDSGSASASEILAGDLVLLDRAVIVGARSYGKGTVQKVYTLEEGGESGRGVLLKLTVAEYRLAGDTPVTEAGLTPDLALDTAIFDSDGVDLPAPSSNDAALTVDERPGWRGDGGGAGRDDVALDAAERVIARADGAHRADLLFAVDRVRDEIRAEQDDRLVATMALRGIDWTASAGATPTRPPTASIQLSIADPPIAGRTVELRAFVDNRGTTDIVRGVVRLSSQDGPWDGVELPIGRIAAGTTGIGKALVRLPTTDGDREDLVTATLSCDACSTAPPGVETVLTVSGAERPPLEVAASWIADRQQVELALTNEGRDELTGLRARFAFPDSSAGFELVDRDATVGVLYPGARVTIDLALKLGAGASGPIPLDLVVDSDQFPNAFAHRFSMVLPLDGTAVRVEGPTLTSRIPSSLPTGAHPIDLRAADDRGLASLTVWCDGDKIAWRPGSGRHLDSVVPLTIAASGPHLLTIDLVDVDGIERVLRYPIRGADDDGAAAVP
jgi:C-terminal peptidase prc